jgi:hypothetical protein
MSRLRTSIFYFTPNPTVMSSNPMSIIELRGRSEALVELETRRSEMPGLKLDCRIRYDPNGRNHEWKSTAFRLEATDGYSPGDLCLV